MNHELQSRNPWVAGVMSLALPGWGQLYNGQANRAIWCFLIFALVVLPGTALFALVVPPVLMVPALLVGLAGSLGLWMYCAVDAFAAARRSIAYLSKPWQTSGLYALVFIVCALLVLPSLTMYMRAHLVQPFRIPSTSMAPSLLPGDFVFADMRYNCPGCRAVQRGDVAIFTYPNDRTMYYVKRVVALPGDRVRVVNQQLFLNGQALAAQGDGATGFEHWGARTWRVQGGASGSGTTHVAAHADVATDAGSATEAEQIVPPGQVFLLGDNRSDSVDSRSFGAVPLADVVGRARQIWFSRGDGSIRWNRIGEPVK